MYTDRPDLWFTIGADGAQAADGLLTQELLLLGSEGHGSPF
ncbi:hypothetical protein MAB47J26_22561 [Mycobacteroides abscessus 47J26]|nr:hypothetical protein MAB47J26_22561 [Mycobacteroides abscessus 47J26]